MSEAARWTTGYGMNPWRVVGTAILLVLVSAVLYPTTGGLTETVVPGGETAGVNDTATRSEQTTITCEIEDPQDAPPYYVARVFYRSLYFSVVTFTTLGYGDISPEGDVARAIAGVEALLGQLFMALLVFVLTRRIS
jgi:voltage-gated potassium channel Kch